MSREFDTTKPIGLDEFANIASNDVQRFKENWLENRQKDPSMWPAEMSEGDWFDQFLCFVTGELP